MNKGAFVAMVAAGVVVVDQLTKWLVRRDLPLHEVIPVVPAFFSLTHATNPGGAFSLFAGAHEAFRLPFFFVATAVAIAVLIYFLREIPSQQRWLLFAVAGVLGGAIGNLIDRIAFGEVTDFLLVYHRGWYWPAFNVADSFITVGVGILVAHSLFVGDAPAPDPRRTD